MNTYHLNKKLIIFIITFCLLSVSTVHAVNDSVFPTSVSVQSDYILSDTVAVVGDTITIRRTCINNETNPLTCFYFCDILPNEFSIISHTVTINGISVSYDYPTPSTGSAFFGYNEHYWVLDYPGSSGLYNQLVQPNDTVVIEYKVICSTTGTFALPMHTFISHNGTTGIFGYSDSLKVRFDISLDIDDEQTLPQSFSLSQNYPNPFNPSTIIDFSLPERSFVTIEIYNLLGQSVTKLVQENLSAGNHSVTWNGLQNDGKTAPSGVYFYKLLTGNKEITKKMLLLK